jgi:hypothetical protein
MVASKPDGGTRDDPSMYPPLAWLPPAIAIDDPLHPRPLLSAPGSELRFFSVLSSRTVASARTALAAA